MYGFLVKRAETHSLMKVEGKKNRLTKRFFSERNFYHFRQRSMGEKRGRSNFP